MRLFPGIFGPKRLVLRLQICGLEDWVVHSQADDVVTARQGDGLAYGHERTIGLFAGPGDVSVDVDWPVFDDSCGDLIGLDRHRVLAPVRRPLPKDLRREHGLHLALHLRRRQTRDRQRPQQRERNRSIQLNGNALLEFGEPGHGDLDHVSHFELILGLCWRDRT